MSGSWPSFLSRGNRQVSIGSYFTIWCHVLIVFNKEALKYCSTGISHFNYTTVSECNDVGNGIHRGNQSVHNFFITFCYLLFLGDWWMDLECHLLVWRISYYKFIYELTQCPIYNSHICLQCPKVMLSRWFKDEWWTAHSRFPHLPETQSFLYVLWDLSVAVTTDDEVDQLNWWRESTSTPPGQNSNTLYKKDVQQESNGL